MQRLDATVSSERVTGALRRLDRQLTFVSLLKGAAICFTIFAAGVGLALMLDRFIGLSTAWRVGALAVICTTFLAGLAYWLMLPLLKRRRPLQLAAAIENAYPHLQERFTSFLELNDPRLTQTAPAGSIVMTEWLAAETEAAVNEVDVREAWDADRLLQRVAFAAAAGLFLIVSLMLAGSGYGLLLKRLFIPWGNYATASNLYFEIEPGDVTRATGSDVTFFAHPQWHRGEGNAHELTAWLHWRDNGGDEQSRRMNYDDRSTAFVTTLPGALSSLDYWITAADAQSREYHLRIVDPPKIERLSIEATPPSYAARPSRHWESLGEPIEVFEQSRLAWELTFNKPIVSGELRFDEPAPANRRADAAGEDRVAAQQETFPLEISSDRLTAHLSMTAERSGRFSIEVTDADGLTIGVGQGELLIRADESPLVAWLDNRNSITARPDDVVPLRFRASDDIGLADIELHYEQLNAEGQPAMLPLAGDVAGRREIESQFEFDLGALDVSHGTLISVRVRASDTRVSPEPNVGWSTPKLISIHDEADLYDGGRLTQQQQQIQEILEALRKQVAKSRDAVDDLRVQAEEDRGRSAPEFTRQDDLQAQEETVERTADELQTLAKVLEQHPLYKRLTDDLNNVAERPLNEADEALDRAVEKQLNAKAEPLTEAQRKLEQAEKQLADISEEFANLAELERGLAELQRLARDAEQLADNVDEFQQQRDVEQSPQEQMQEQLEQQFDGLVNDHQELTKDFDDALAERPEIADAARQAQKNQLEELAKSVQALVQPQQRVANALKQTDEQLQREARELAKDQKRLNDDLQRLVKQEENAAKQRAEERKRQAEQDKKVGNEPPEPPQLNGEEGIAGLENKPFEQAANDIGGGKFDEAAKNQQQAVEELKKAQEQAATQETGVASENDALRKQQEPLEKLTQRQQELQQRTEQLQRAQNVQPPQQATDENLAASDTGNTPQSPEPGEPQPGAEGKTPQSPAAVPTTPEEIRDLDDQIAQAERENRESVADRLQELVRGEQQLAQAGEAQSEALKDAGEALQQACESASAPAMKGGEATKKIEATRQTLEQATGKMNQANQQASQGQLGPASQDAKQATDLLRRAAQQAGEAARSVPNGESPVPKETADSIAQASRQLADAGEQLAQLAPNGEPPPQSAPSENQPGQPPADGEGQPSDGEPGQREGPDGQPPGQPPGQPQPGQQPGQQGQPMPSSAASQSLREMASTLNQALQALQGQSQPGQSQPGQPQQAQSSSTPDGSEGDAKPGQQGQEAGGRQGGEIDLSELQVELAKFAQKDWGKLPGTLEADLLQSATKRADGDYESLIQRYFDSLSQRVESNGAGKPEPTE